ncbi:hypothetical protein MAH1_23330 [Sessilibacter sp. MAH1]
MALSGCQNYEVTLNEKEVYTPPQVITALEFDDAALENCISLFIEENGVTEYGQLSNLVCTHAGIENLKGINRFRKLKQINLADNQIKDLAPLQGLSSLEKLSIKNNQIKDVQTLLNLPKLQYLDLSGNDQVLCEDVKLLERVAGIVVIAPEHCQ